MPYLFDFGISQEDPLSEQRVLEIRPGDTVLSVASGGEVPLSLLGLNENIHIKAVDVSEAQVKLCRLKLISALNLDFPQNGRFLGYAALEGRQRKELYRDTIRSLLPHDDAGFWDRNLTFIEKGIINTGRFEQYIRKMRLLAGLLLGRKNIYRLLDCQTPKGQQQIFRDYIAPRKSLQLLFKIAFHPAVYKKRGLQEQALIHAATTTGEIFYSKFKDFCTASLSSENYFLQYFLTGCCITESAFPEYLQPANRNRLVANQDNFELATASLQEALREKEAGFYNKIHLSNVGDWMSEADFSALLLLMQSRCHTGTKICYRYLQKNHFLPNGKNGFLVHVVLSGAVERRDRFPFYNILPITLHSEENT